MIQNIIKNNYDCLLATQNLRGSVFIKENNKISNLIDGTVPPKLTNKQALLARLGTCCVLRTSKLRTGKILDGKIGYYKVNNPFSFVEVNKANINKFNVKNFKNILSNEL